MLLLLEIALLSCAVCAVHSLRPKLGLAPLYLLIGLFEAFLFFAGKPSVAIEVELLGGDTGHAFLLFLPGMLVSVCLVYVLEGTSAARQLIAGIVVLYVAHGVFDVLLEHHGTHPPGGGTRADLGDLLYYSTHSRVASLVAVTVDVVVMIVVYQGVANLGPRLPLAFPLFAALLAAMVCDGVVYQLVRRGALGLSGADVLAKAQAGVAAGIPAALYFALQLRRHPGDVRDGLVARGALEIVDLRRQVSEMQVRLKEQRAQYLYVKDTFSRYVSPDVVDAIIADPSKLRLGGELRDVTILFADIRGYSTLSERMAPTEVIGFLNTYFREMSRIILSAKGMINEFEGDAVLAVFGAPLDLEDHADRAVRAALEMLEAVEVLNATWTEDGTAARWQAAGVDGLAIRIGVHSGPVVAGNIGSEVRTKYAVIGDTVNTASRVEGLNKPLKTSLLLSQRTVDLLTDEGLVERAESLGVHAVKGRREPVPVYTIRPAPIRPAPIRPLP